MPERALTLFESILQLHRNIRAGFETRVQRQGLTYARARLLAVIGHNQGASQTELAQLLGIETPTLKRQLDALEALGLAERRPLPEDGRKHAIFLTAAARVEPLLAYRADVEAALADDIDALILVPTDPDGLQPSVARAEAAGIPVITVDTTVSDQGYLTSHITGDNVDGGRQAARTLAEQIGGQGKVFIMSGSPGATTNTLREQGFREELAANFPKVEIIGREYANSQPANATSAINTVLLNHPDLAGIFAIDGTSGTGAVAALRNSGAVGKVKLVGYDAYKAQVEALQEGVFTALVAQQPAREAELAMEYAKARVTGEGADKIEKSVVIPNIVMTSENFAQTGSAMYSD